MRSVVFKYILFKGYKMAKNRSNVTDNVIKTEPTLPICAIPYLKILNEENLMERKNHCMHLKAFSEQMMQEIFRKLVIDSIYVFNFRASCYNL